MAAMPVYGKTLKNLLLQNKENFEAESWYAASGTQSTKFVEMMILKGPLTLWYSQISVLVAVAIPEEIAWHLQLCKSCFYQVSKSGPWASCLNIFLIFPPKNTLTFF